MLMETLVTALPAGTAASRGAGKLGSAGSDQEAGECREADVICYHETDRNEQIVHFKYMPLSGLQLYLNKVGGKKQRASHSSTTSKVYCCPTALGKQVLMRKFN